MHEIYCKDCEHFDKCVRGYMPDCPVYYPKKGIMTNEEWLEQASTEEKALFLARLYGHSRKIDLSELIFRNVGTGEVTGVAEYIGQWLKEKHE